MSKAGDPVTISPDLHNPTTHLFGAHLSLSDSDPDFDLDVDPTPIFEPDFLDPLDNPHYYYHHHQQQPEVIFSNDSFYRNDIIGPNLELGLSGPTTCESSSSSVGGGGGVNLDLGLGLTATSSMSKSDDGFIDGLRVVNVDSDSDSEIFQDFGGFGGVSDFDRPPYCWDYLGFNNPNTHQNNNLNVNDYGNIDDNVNDVSICHDDDVGGVGNNIVEDDFLYNDFGVVEDVIEIEDENDEVDTDVSIVFETYQEREEQREISIDSDDGGLDFGVDDAIRDLEWEILLAVNNFNREVYDMDFNVDMYEAILGEVEERMNDWRGSPPTAESVVESLPTVLLSNEDLKEKEVVCAICKDDVSEEEVVRQLPCLHYYHGDCILPWLKMRNTCPVCRFELPTDDAEYESRKRVREGSTSADAIIVDGDDVTLDDDPQVSHDFHVFL